MEVDPDYNFDVLQDSLENESKNHFLEENGKIFFCRLQFCLLIVNGPNVIAVYFLKKMGVLSDFIFLLCL